MKSHTLISRLMAALLTASLLMQTQSALASGMATADLLVLAEGGNSMAQRTLGERFAMGIEGVIKDTNQAIFWWQQAADKGDAAAQYYLGQMYRQGVVVMQGWVQAHMWFSLVETSNKRTAAAMQRKKQAESNRQAAETNMTAEQIKEAQLLAQEWLAKHK